MRQIRPHPLWIGHSGDARDPRGLFAAGIGAVVDLALDMPPADPPRELVYCRFPLVDGGGNPAWLLRAAVETTAGLLRANVPTLVACGGGMSRSPAVTAIALALTTGHAAAACLELIASSGPGDVSPALWHDVVSILAGTFSKSGKREGGKGTLPGEGV